MNPLHRSLDETVVAIREAHEAELKTANDRVFAAEVKAELLQTQLNRATEARASAERITSKLIAQFGMVEAVFAEAKALALAQQARPEEVQITDGTEIQP